MKHRTRKRLSLVVLIIGLPAYLVVAMVLVSQIERPHFLVELAIYIALGVLWVLPFRRLFRGVARDDPEAARHGSDQTSAR